MLNLISIINLSSYACIMCNDNLDIKISKFKLVSKIKLA